jgi:hypothetical protein
VEVRQAVNLPNRFQTFFSRFNHVTSPCVRQQTLQTRKRRIHRSDHDFCKISSRFGNPMLDIGFVNGSRNGDGSSELTIDSSRSISDSASFRSWTSDTYPFTRAELILC